MKVELRDRKGEQGYLTDEASGYARHLLKRWALIQQEIAEQTIEQGAAIAMAQAEIQEVKNSYADEVGALEDELQTLGQLNEKSIGSVASELKYTSGYNRVSWKTEILERWIDALALIFPGVADALSEAKKVTPVKPRVKLAMLKHAESLLRSNVEKEAAEWEGWGS